MPKDIVSTPEQELNIKTSLFHEARHYAKSDIEKQNMITNDINNQMSLGYKEMILSEILQQNEPYRYMALLALKAFNENADIKITLKNTGPQKIFKFGVKAIGKTKHNTDLLADNLKMLDEQEIFTVSLVVGIYLLVQYGKNIPGPTLKKYRPLVEVPIQQTKK